MMKTSRIAIVIILASIVAMAAPASAAMFHGQSESDRAEKIVEIADRAGERVEELIDLVSLNTTAIEDAGLIDDFNGNVTLFEDAKLNVTNAYDALDAEDYAGATANATEALSVFREVLTSIHIIMQESGIAKGDIIEAQGLLVAMRRALDRIEKLRDILAEYEETSPEDVLEALALLDEAETYLNIETAKQWLLDGNVTETVHNITQANHLISDAHQILKEIAKEGNGRRIDNYLGQMDRARDRCREREQNANYEGVDVNSVLQSLGYQNMSEFIQTLQNMTANAKEMDDLNDIMNELNTIGQNIRELDHALTNEIGHYRAQHGQLGASIGSGFGQGNMGHGNSGNDD